MLRLVSRRSPYLAAGSFVASLLYLWFLYHMFAVNPPSPWLPYAIILSTPLGLLVVYMCLFLRGEDAWEVTRYDLRHLRGTDVILERDLAQVRGVVASLTSGTASLTVTDLDGKRVLEFISGVFLSPNDVQWFYEALAHYLLPHDVPVSGPTGWRPRPPPVPIRYASGGWMTIQEAVGAAIPHTFVVTGFTMAAFGAEWESFIHILAGVSLVIGGVALWFHRRRERRRRSDDAQD